MRFEPSGKCAAQITDVQLRSAHALPMKPGMLGTQRLYTGSRFARFE
jgi:hypothetical protein